MADQNNRLQCKYHNYGFCRYRNSCTFFHATGLCFKKSCRDRNCQYRHPKDCRYKEKCRRGIFCLYKHENKKTEHNITRVKYQEVEANKNLVEEIKGLKANIENLKQKLSQVEKNFEEEQTVKDSLQKSNKMEKDTFNVKYMKIETENGTLTKEVNILQTTIETIKIELREVTKNMETVKMKNDITQKSMKMVMCDNNKLKTKNEILKAELETLKSELAHSNLTENNTDQLNEEFEAEAVLQEAEHILVESVTSQLLKVNCSMTPVPLECDLCEFIASNKDSLKTHRLIKHFK